MKTTSFEDYLIDVHAEQYVGLDDEMPDDFNNWLSELGCEDYIKYADIYARKAYLLGQASAYNKTLETIKKL